MKGKVLVAVIIVTILSCNHSKTTFPIAKERAINLKEFDFWWYHPVIGKIVVEKLSDTTDIKLFLRDYRGALSFEIYDSRNKQLIEKGIYSNGLDVFKYYEEVFNLQKQENRTIVKEYYQPLPDSTWVIYLNDKTIRKSHYKNGIIDL